MINSSRTPHGAQIGIYVSAAGHRMRPYTMSLFEGVIYTLNAYLPRNTTNGTGDDCISKGYIDYFIITNPAIDVWKTLTYTVDFIESVEVYNASVKYWYEVNYTYYTANNTINIDTSRIDVNTTMAKITYYYLDCTNQTASYLYRFQVIVDAPQGLTIKNASIVVKRYVNTTGLFDTISSMYTDSNGYFSVYLVPNTLYKIICNKDGYDEEIVNFIPDAILFSHVIKMAPSAVINPSEYIYNEHVVFDGYIDRTTLILYVNFTDDLNNTINCSIFVYEYDYATNTTSLFGFNITTGNDSVYPSFPGANNLNTYTVVLRHNSSDWGYQTQSFIIGPRIIRLTTPGYTNRILNANYGFNPFGWTNCIMVVILIIFLFYGNRDDLPLAYICLGVIFVFANIVIGLFTWNVHAGDFIPVMLIIAGILTAWQRYR